MAVEQEVTISMGATRMPAAFALPESGEGPWPGVVVIHEILGLNDDIRRIAARFADEGYAAVTPDLFAGQGPMPICVMRTVAAYRRGGGRPFEAVTAAQAWLGDRDEVDGSRLAVAGFCMGGGFALMLGVRSNVAAAASFYGSVPSRAKDLEGICPVVSGYGGRDRLFAQQGRQLDSHLRDLGVPHDVKIYDDAGHSFMSQREGISGAISAAIGGLSPLRAGYNEPAAEDSWTRMLAFFAEHLGAA